MILISVILIIIVLCGVFWFFLISDKTETKVYEFIKKAKDAAYKTVKPVCEIFIKIKNFFGKIFKQAGK